MVRLTAELIADSPQFTNPVSDRELDLRGNNNNLLLISAHQMFLSAVARLSLHVKEGRPGHVGGSSQSSGHCFTFHCV